MIDAAEALQTVRAASPTRLYPRLLGAAWATLHPAVQRAHTAPADIQAAGIFQVGRGPGGLTRRILDVARVPRSSRAARVRLVVSHRGLAERWHRSFGGVSLVTRQYAAPGGLLAERMHLLEFRFRLAVEHGALLYRQVGFAVWLGPLRIPLPEWLAITIAAREGPADGTKGADGTEGAGNRTTVDVRVTAPTGTLLFAYRGTVCWSARA